MNVEGPFFRQGWVLLPIRRGVRFLGLTTAGAELGEIPDWTSRKRRPPGSFSREEPNPLIFLISHVPADPQPWYPGLFS